jgi:pyruvate kinase
MNNNEEVYSELLSDLQVLLNQLLAFENEHAEFIHHSHKNHKASTINLIHYLGLRRHDLRALQSRLALAGLSSLGRSEPDVVLNLESIIYLLETALQGKNECHEKHTRPKKLISGALTLKKNADNIFGSNSLNRDTRILVTLSSESSDDYALVKEMMLKGMNCARINCAHDDAPTWQRMIRNIKRAANELGQECKILMDLAGPKLRTGEIAFEPSVIKIKPERNIYGQVLAPAKLLIYPKYYSDPLLNDTCIPVSDSLLTHANIGDTIELIDARGAKRQLKLVDKKGKVFWGECNNTLYITAGIKLKLSRALKPRHPKRGEVEDLGNSEKKIRLYLGDHLILTRLQFPGMPVEYTASGHVLFPAKISCSLPEIYSMVNLGERILIDDGKIEGVIESINSDELLIKITQAGDRGEKLLADKGINLPDSTLTLDALTLNDIQNLEFIVKNADMVGYSFCRSANDVELLQKNLNKLHAENLTIILKVETRAAFEHLPAMFFSVLRSSNAGVMIARGDLAVECGYERLAELQEEILCLSQAAHLPLIWATQVLEGVAKNGKPSRAEITDAAMSERAECVMLNKGPHIIEAIVMLDNILLKMQGHQTKKTSLLRQLHW